MGLYFGGGANSILVLLCTAIAIHPARDGERCETLKAGLSCLLGSRPIPDKNWDFTEKTGQSELRTEATPQLPIKRAHNVGFKFGFANQTPRERGNYMCSDRRSGP